MNPEQRAALTKALSAHVGAIAADLRAQMLAEGPVRRRAKQLHIDEQVGEDFNVWTDLLSRRAAVLWVLKTVYVRVLEDRGLLRPGRLIDPESQHLFEKLAPNLGETAFLRYVFRDLASARGGLPELFAPQPAEVAEPDHARSRALIAFWHARDADTGQLQWSFSEEAFAGELMGDLYQELDPVVKDRYALCQTPDFVRDFMLGQTLVPAIEELGADAVRVLDPACGSGHFLLDALRRLVEATAAQHPDWPRRRVVEHALDRVVGIDLNDYACALARVRMVMTAAELAGVTSLEEAAAFHPHVYWADGLEQIERDEEEQQPTQLDLLGPNQVPPPRAVLTRPHVRAMLRPILKQKFQVVVANPPYITERDPARKEYHREMVGSGKKKARRYIAAYRDYSLAAPFVERCLQLAEEGGRLGLIIGNNFMKREFGKPLIEEVLADKDLDLVVDTSQAFIPHHGTSTIILFARNQVPEGATVRAVMGKRGETGTPSDPAKGKAWLSIIEGFTTPGFESEFVSVADIPRESLGRHPWSLGGGGASQLKVSIEKLTQRSLQEIALEIGRTTVCGEDPVYIMNRGATKRLGILDLVVPLTIGEVVRDWAIQPTEWVIYPYVSLGGEHIPPSHSGVSRYFWQFRTLLRARSVFGKSLEERGGPWYQHLEHYAERLQTPLSIAFAFVATHNHFVLDRGGKVFKQTAPVIKLPSSMVEDDHLLLLGLLNSSTACFWMKQVFHCKGSQGVNEGAKAELWEQFYEFDSTKMKLFPIPEGYGSVLSWAREIDRLARRRAERSVAWILSGDGWKQAAELRVLFEERRKADLADLGQMVALQEELDWECYRLYNIDSGAKARKPEEVQSNSPNWRPVELNLAVRDRETRTAIERGDETTELPTMWFQRHGWEPLTELPSEAPQALRELVAARRARIESTPGLALIEQPTYKRRWYHPDYEAEEQAALASWLADQIERTLCERGGKPCTLEQLTTELEDVPRVQSVAELLAGRKDFRLTELVEVTVRVDSVPDHPFHIYKPGGLEKRKAWERTWEEQRKEDAGLPAKPEVPPKYGSGDFLKPEYFRLRGKLDVPKERFIAFTQVPGRGSGETLYGWAGWTPAERIRAILDMDEECEDKGIAIADRIALLDSAWRLIPDVMREDPARAGRFKAELQALVGPDGPSKALLEDWKTKYPPPGKGRGQSKKVKAAKAAKPEDEEDDDA